MTILNHSTTDSTANSALSGIAPSADERYTPSKPMRLLRKFKAWFFSDFMTMTVRALVLSESVIVLWSLAQWTTLPLWACAIVTGAAWAGLIRAQPRFTWGLRRRHFEQPLVRFAVRAYFALCLACMLATFALIPVWLAYVVGWPVAHFVSEAAVLWWNSAFHILSTAAVALAFGLILYGSSIGQAFVRRPHTRVPLPHLPAAFRGLRIVHLSDFHLGHHMHGAQVERCVARVNALDPDLIVITGDIFDHDPVWIDRTLPALGKRRATHGVFAILGNHDCYTGADEVAAGLARHTDFRVLRDEWTPLTVADGTIYIIGLDDPSTHFGQWSIDHFPLQRVIADLPDDGPAMLLCHRPDVWPLAVEAGIPLTLAGHTHGGQIALPGSRRFSLASFITKFQWGWFERAGCRLYVSRGIGVVGSAIRIGAPREIAIHELHPAPHHAPVPERTLQPAEAPAE